MMKVLNITEAEDGSGLIEFEITGDEKDALIKIGLEYILLKHIEDIKERQNGNREPVVDA